jgi:hypothetical protein
MRKSALTNPDEKTEYWNIDCPHCRCYARIRLATNPPIKKTRWPLLLCSMCRMIFTFAESSQMIFLRTDREKCPDRFWLSRSKTVEALSLLHRRDDPPRPIETR